MYTFDYLKKIDEIVDKLINVHHADIGERIKDLVRSGFTGGEILSSVTSELKSTLKMHPELANVIGKDVNDLNIYCQSIGMHIY